MRKIVLTFGLIAGGIMSAMLLLSVPFMERIGFDNGAIFGYTTMVLAFLMVFFGIKSYRDNVAGGQISFGRALKVGSLISLVATVCYVATWEVVFYNFIPDFPEKYAAYAVDKAQQSGSTEAEIAALQQEMAEFSEMYRNPVINVAFTFLEPLPVALVFTLVSAGMLSRKRREERVAVAGT